MFDNICKFIAENFSDDLATWLLGSPLPLTVLDPTELQLDPIRADSLIFLQSEQLILQTPKFLSECSIIAFASIVVIPKNQCVKW